MISNDSKDSRDQHPDEEEILEASVPGHPNDLQKTEISKWVADGMGLSEVQKKIDDEFGIVMTYMDVRFLVDDLNLTLGDEEEPEPQESDDSNADPGSQDTDDLTPESSLLGESGVSVEVDPVTPPGAMASGSVTFSDGQQKKWSLDQFGRLGLSGGNEGYKPSDEDVMEFQKKLDSALRGKGF